MGRVMMNSYTGARSEDAIISVRLAHDVSDRRRTQQESC